MLRRLTTWELQVDGRTYEEVRGQLVRALALAEKHGAPVDEVRVKFDGTARYVQWTTTEDIP